MPYKYKCMGYRKPDLCNRCAKLPKDNAEELAAEWLKIRRDPYSDECYYFEEIPNAPAK